MLSREHETVSTAPPSHSARGRGSPLALRAHLFQQVVALSPFTVVPTCTSADHISDTEGDRLNSPPTSLRSPIVLPDGSMTPIILA